MIGNLPENNIAANLAKSEGTKKKFFMALPPGSRTSAPARTGVRQLWRDRRGSRDFRPTCKTRRRPASGEVVVESVSRKETCSKTQICYFISPSNLV